VTIRFLDLGVPADLVDVLDARHIVEPFAIQHAAIPDALAGRDVCGQAPTGSGKTLAFGIPLVARVTRAERNRPHGLVLAPTRELAAQIHRELQPLAAVRQLRVAVAYGGVSYGPQRQALRQGVDILVACPGRLLDLIQQGVVELGDVQVVVVDEADRLADMGFLPAVRRLLDLTPDTRQTMLFSATLDGEVARLTGAYQRQPRRHEIEPVDAHLCRHSFWRVDESDRTVLAADVIRHVGATVVFCRTRHGADRLARKLVQHGVLAAPIHGGRTQGQRDRALAAFADGQVRALVATDVAARGIHVDDVACVLHYDHPADHTTYLHRSGRTSRAGATGIVVSFVTADRASEVRITQRALGLVEAFQKPDVEELTNPQRGAGLAEHVRTTDGAVPRQVVGATRRAPGRSRRGRRSRAAQPDRARS
jgi:superfamily II DNA/RNA helicase